jgi:hypothetical protein
MNLKKISARLQILRAAGCEMYYGYCGGLNSKRESPMQQAFEYPSLPATRPFPSQAERSIHTPQVAVNTLTQYIVCSFFFIAMEWVT